MEGTTMYARLISFSGADPQKRDSAIEMIRGTVIPMLQTYDGFAGYISLYDADEHRAKAIILWSSRDAADAAEETLAERRKQMVDQVGLTIESVSLYEAPVVELAGAPVQRAVPNAEARRSSPSSSVSSSTARLSRARPTPLGPNPSPGASTTRCSVSRVSKVTPSGSSSQM